MNKERSSHIQNIKERQINYLLNIVVRNILDGFPCHIACNWWHE